MEFEAMNDEVFMIPTRVRTKIASSLAYPLNAKLISEALAEVPQAQEFSLSFTDYPPMRRERRRPEIYPTLFVYYSHLREFQQTPWDIRVQPVPSTLKHHVKELLQAEAFPKIIEWLLTKQNLAGKEARCYFRVCYDEGKDELQMDEHTSA